MKNAGYSPDDAKDVAEDVSDRFDDLSHDNKNLGFYMAVVRWMAEYAGNAGRKAYEFIDKRLPGIIKTLRRIFADKSYGSRREEIKNMTLPEFEKLQDEVSSSVGGRIRTAGTPGEYEVVPVTSYEELYEKYGGTRTGDPKKPKSAWCHTNGESTYDSWTGGGSMMFFVVQRKGWEEITPPDPETVDTAYDDYGMSLIAILVGIRDNELLKSTLRWNHVVAPATGDVDEAFDSWRQLNDAVGIDVEAKCREWIEASEREDRKSHEDANRRLA